MTVLYVARSRAVPPPPLLLTRRRDFFASMTQPPDGVPYADTPIEVRSPELDAFGHVNHAVFLNYLEHGRFALFRTHGFTWDALEERRWGIFVVRVEIDYVSEARREDHLVVRTWVDSFRRTSMVFRQVIFRADDPKQVVTRSLVTAVWVGADGKPIRVPGPVREALGPST